jgi:hypothetical protein
MPVNKSTAVPFALAIGGVAVPTLATEGPKVADFADVVLAIAMGWLAGSGKGFSKRDAGL